MKFGNVNIGGMSFGSVKIGGAKYGNTLVFQPGEPPTPVDPGDISNYVQDGLVFHLDGIDKGETSGRWSSPVGSEYYTLTSHSTSETNAVLMDGNGLLASENKVDVGYSSGTIEVCAQDLGSANHVVIYGVTGNLCFGFYGTDYFFGMGASNNAWTVTRQSLYTCSINSSRCMMNGSVVGTKVNQSWSSNTARNYIGGRDNYANHYYGNVRIYSIRKYNRILTEAEMLKNQKVDNARFNLGLNIQ